jgi:Amiloride-sensitive sodium channel
VQCCVDENFPVLIAFLADFRFFWIASMSLALSIFCFLMFQTTQKFFEDKVVLELSRKPISLEDVFFPTVTLCPQIFHKENFPHVDWSSFVSSNYE